MYPKVRFHQSDHSCGGHLILQMHLIKNSSSVTRSDLVLSCKYFQQIAISTFFRLPGSSKSNRSSVLNCSFQTTCVSSHIQELVQNLSTHLMNQTHKDEYFELKTKVMSQNWISISTNTSRNMSTQVLFDSVTEH